MEEKEEIIHHFPEVRKVMDRVRKEHPILEEALLRTVRMTNERRVFLFYTTGLLRNKTKAKALYDAIKKIYKNCSVYKQKEYREIYYEFAY